MSFGNDFSIRIGRGKEKQLAVQRFHQLSISDSFACGVFRIAQKESGNAICEKDSPIFLWDTEHA